MHSKMDHKRKRRQVCQSPEALPNREEVEAGREGADAECTHCSFFAARQRVALCARGGSIRDAPVEVHSTSHFFPVALISIGVRHGSNRIDRLTAESADQAPDHEVQLL